MKDISKNLLKTAVYAKLAKKGLKTVKAAMNDVEWDKDYWLHKVGLSSYKPARFGAGGFGLFVIGAVAGGLIGLALAPKAGAELRSEMKQRLDTWRADQMGTTSNISDAGQARA